MMSDGWMMDWVCGLGLIALTLIFHAFGLVLIGLALSPRLRRLAAHRHHLSRVIPNATLLIGAAGWMLAVLHGLDGALWAAAYTLLGAVGSFHQAMLYSVDCMATLGASGVVLQSGWSLLGPLEGANGMLLFGVSTAFLFAVFSRVWQHLAAAEKQFDDPSATQNWPGRR